MDLGKNILRCECRLYPDLFPEKRFSVSESFIFDRFSMDTVDPFESIKTQIIECEQGIAKLTKLEDPSDRYVEVYRSINIELTKKKRILAIEKH